MVINELRGATKLGKELNEFKKYWEEYKGEEVVIRKNSVSPVPNDPSNPTTQRGDIQQTEYIIRGTVETVTKIPPGFKLTDVEETINISDVSIQLLSATEEKDVLRDLSGGGTVREVPEKFVSFSMIDELEPAGSYDSANMPGESII